MIYEIDFGEWLPDQPSYQNPGLVEATNCYPAAGGYVPLNKAVAQGATTTEVVTGANMFFTTAGDALVVGGSSTRLFTNRSGTVTETAGYNATASGWRFERFNDLVIGVSIENDPQYLTDLDSDDTWSTITGTPPKAAQVGRVDDFLVFGDLVDNADGGSATAPSRVRWSAKNDPTATWDTDRASLAGYRDLPSQYGRVTAIVGGRFGLVFQERAIWRMVFVGKPRSFQFEEVSTERGCVASGSAVQIGTDVFFLSEDGFAVTNGTSAQTIGEGRVNDFFGGDVDPANVGLTHGAINWPQRSIVWAYYQQGTNTFTGLMIYNFVLDRWSFSNQMVNYLVQFQVNSETLATLAATYTDLAGMSAFTLGEQQFKAQNLLFAAFVGSGSGSDLAVFNGEAAAASFLTGDFMIQPGRRAEVSGVWPTVETTSSAITTSVRSRSQQGATPSVSSPTTKGADGFCPHKVDNWIHAVRMTIPEGTTWTKAVGAMVRATATGRR